MTLFALSQEASDFYTLGGFWIGLLGTVVGIAGFAIAIYQVHEARKAAEASKSAAEAAKEAAQRVLAESIGSYERFVADHAGRLLTELRAAVLSAEWKVAALRARHG